MGRFCHICGQENLEPKESIGALINHFFSDITHFDGKFFQSTALLFRKPGFLSKEYILGRRARYLNPIRFYVFTSAVFFLVFFSLFDAGSLGLGNSANKKVDADSLLADIRKDINTRGRDAAPAIPIQDSAENILKDSSPIKSKFIPSNKQEYDSVQATLPEAKKDSWLNRQLKYRSMALEQKYKEDDRSLMINLIDKFLHSFPYLLFISLPLYALYLKMLYWRKKNLYYVDHGIFLIHLYIFTFLLLLLLVLVVKVGGSLSDTVTNILQTILLTYGIFYALKAMKNFYEGGWKSTILKFLVFNLLAFVSIIFLFVIFMFITVYRI